MKRQLAKAVRISDFNRIGIFDPVSKKTLKDKNAPIREHEEVIKHGEIFVKDLGMSLSCFFFLFFFLRGGVIRFGIWGLAGAHIPRCSFADR